MIKKILSHIRTSIKLTVLIILAAIIITAIVVIFYKPTYSVSLNGEQIGYSNNKAELQAKINNYMTKGNGENVAFVQINNLPEYKLCLLKKDVEYNDEQIYSEVIENGIPYYKYYALTIDGEEKSYIQKFEDAEEIVKQLKEKNSTNKESLAIVEKYEKENKEFTNIEEAVAKLYVKPVEQKKVVISKTETIQTNKKQSNIGMNFINPTQGIITSRFGQRSRNNHKGIDIGANRGTPIKAAASGTVTKSSYGYNGGYGNFIIISHGNGVQTYYGHCSTLNVKVGQTVSQGQVIAAVGSTGRSTGNHLHFEIRVNGVAQNPEKYTY